MAEKKKTAVWKNFLHLIRQIKLPLVLLTAAFVLNIGRAVIQLTVPEKIAGLTELDLAGGSTIMKAVIASCVLIFVLALIEFVFGLASTYITYIAKARINRDFQTVAARKVFSLTTAEVEARDPKVFISRITTDTGFVSDFLIDLLVIEVPRLYFLISTMIKVSQMGNGTLAIGFIVVIPVIVLGSFWSGRVTYKAQSKLQTAIARLTAKLAEKVEVRTRKSAVHGFEEDAGGRPLQQLGENLTLAKAAAPGGKGLGAQSGRGKAGFEIPQQPGIEVLIPPGCQYRDAETAQRDPSRKIGAAASHTKYESLRLQHVQRVTDCLTAASVADAERFLSGQSSNPLLLQAGAESPEFRCQEMILCGHVQPSL